MLVADGYRLLALMPTGSDWFMGVGLFLLLTLSTLFYLGNHKRVVRQESRPARPTKRKRD